MGLFKQIQTILNKSEPARTQAEQPNRPRTERRQRRRLSHKGRKILIIDDSATVVASLGGILKSAGCKISEAGDAETGLSSARNELPDLVFLDIVLPGMNGFTALRHMRRDPVLATVPVIMISGNEQATEQFYAKRIGADDFMKKPFSRHEVFARLEALVGAGKLPALDGTSPVAAQRPGTLPPPAAPAANPTPIPAAPVRNAKHTANLSNDAIARMTPIEARSHLTAMGLQYFSQEQFTAAVERGDKLAVDLFIIGGGIEIKA